MSRFAVYILDSLNPETDLASLSDLELLQLLCSSAEDELPYKLFVGRFLPDLKKECRAICKRRKLDSHIGDQIAHECFEKLRKYKSFSTDKIRIPDDRKAILVYLYKNATRLFYDHYRKETKQNVSHRTYFDDIQESTTQSIDAKDLKKKKDITEFILKSLTPREQQVIFKDLEYKKHQKYLPGDVIEEMANEFKVKPDTIRKIRERAIAKIKNAINGINQAGK